MHDANRYDRNVTIWGSYDGREILIKDLEVRHLVNILNHIKEINEASPGAYEPELYALMVAEAELRIMVGFAKNKGIPKRLEDGTYTLINRVITEKAIDDAKSLMHKQKMEALIRKMRGKQHKKAKKGRPSELNHI